MAFHKLHYPISALLIALILASSLSIFVAPKKAEAQLGSIASCVGGVGSMLLSEVGSSFSMKVPVADAPVISNTTQLQIKEYCLDALAYGIARIIIRQMTQSIITWITSGFNGNPLFLSNPTQFFGDIAQSELNQTLYELENSVSMYARDVAVALVTPKKKEYNLNQAIAQNCIDKEDIQAEFLRATGAPPEQDEESAYLPGDYTTRLARAEERRAAEASKGALAQVFSSIKKNISAAVGTLLAQDFPEDPANPEELGIDQEISAPPSDDPFGTPEQVGYTREQLDRLRTRCPSTPAEQQAQVNQFLGGDFSKGGLGGWYALTQNQENNQVGAILAAQNQVASRQASAVRQAENEVAAGNGFLSEKKCIPGSEVYEEDASGNANLLTCEYQIVTPGSQIATTLGEVTASTFRQAELVKELGEAVDLITTTLLNQMITMGLSEVSKQSPLAGRVLGGAARSAQAAYEADQAMKRNLVGGFDTLIINTQKYIVARQAGVDALRALIASLNTLSNSITTLGGAYSCPLTTAQATPEIARRAEWTSILGNYLQQIDAVSIDHAKLKEIRARAAAASTSDLPEITDAYGQIAHRLPNESIVAGAASEVAIVQAKQVSIKQLENACVAEATAQAANSNSQ